MRIGYPARNLQIGCTPAKTFRLASYTDERFIATVAMNLDCLLATLMFNAEHDLRFFRIGSDLIPFASHPVCKVAWWEHFVDELAAIGAFIHDNGIRISMHPGQFTIVNTPDDTLFASTVAELLYHDRLLNALGLDSRTKLQLHVGGIYGDKSASIERFATRFRELPAPVQARIAVENDDRLFCVADCCRLFDRIGTPIVFDNLHHALLNDGEPRAMAFRMARETWQNPDGSAGFTHHDLPMMDYSDPNLTEGARVGKHAEHVVPEAFMAFVADIADDSPQADYDVMFELKDKEASPLAVLPLLQREQAVV